jgi:hypothetical protein
MITHKEQQNQQAARREYPAENPCTISLTDENFAALFFFTELIGL